MSSTVVTNFCKMREQLRFFSGLIQWMGFRTAILPVKHGARFAGKSTYTFRKLLNLASETIIAYSDKPLRIGVCLGFFISFISLMYGVYITYKAIVYNISIIGWSSIIVSLYFLGGIIICMLGLLGIYVGKTFDETKNRPLYFIQDQININNF